MARVAFVDADGLRAADYRIELDLWPAGRLVLTELGRRFDTFTQALRHARNQARVAGLLAHAAETPEVFEGAVLSKLKASNNRETFAWRLVAVRQPYMIETMMRAAEFERWDARARGFVPKDCPAQVADTYLAREGHWRLPTLLGIVNAPFLRVDGTICDQAGYDAASELLFEPDGQKLLDELKAKNLTRRFDFDGSYRFTEMLENQVNGIIDSWAIRWYASAFLKDKLTLYPGRSLLCNTGTDDSGTHGDNLDSFDTEVSHNPARVERIPLKEDRGARKAITIFFHSLDPEPSLAQRVQDRINRMMSEKP
jgi:hypothetical protein